MLTCLSIPYLYLEPPCRHTIKSQIGLMRLLTKCITCGNYSKNTLQDFTSIITHGCGTARMTFNKL